MSVVVENAPMALEDSVVWYNLKLRGYPRWPCKVTSSPDSNGMVTLESFEDHEKYMERSDKLIPFIHADIGKSCAKDVAKCQQRPATLDQYKGAITEAIAFQKSRDPHFSPPSELEELCRPAHLSTQAAGPLTSTHVQGIASQPAGLMSSTRKRPSSGAYATISQSQWSGEKKEVIAACSPECESKKRRKKSSGMTRTQSRKKRLTDSSPIHPNTNPSNGTSDSCSASLSTVDACPNGGDGGGGGGGGSGGGVLAGLKPPCGVQSHQSVGSEGAMEEKLPKDHASSVNGKDNTGQSGATTNGCHHVASVTTEGSEGSDDDILPSIDMTPQKSIKVKNLKGGEIIWAKYGRFPFWPAMVTSVNRSKKRALVSFLGWSVDEGRIGISNKNIAPFNYLQQERFLQQGRCSQWSEMFSLAFEEANTLVREALPGTPAEQLMSVIARRPKNKQYMVSPMAELGSRLTSDGLVTSAEEEKDSDGDITEDNITGNCNTMEVDNSSSDEEQVSPEYRYDALRVEFETLKPELLAIVEGRMRSQLHTAYCHGSRQQKRAMTRSANFGPARKLPTKQLINCFPCGIEFKLLNKAGSMSAKCSRSQTQLLSFLETITESATTEQRFGHKYCCEVLFPEAMIRVVAKKKGVSPQEAAKEVLQEMDYL